MDPRDANSFAYEGLEETKEEVNEILEADSRAPAGTANMANTSNAPTTTIDTRNNNNPNERRDDIERRNDTERRNDSERRNDAERRNDSDRLQDNERLRDSTVPNASIADTDIVPPQQAYFDSNTAKAFDERAAADLDYRQGARWHTPEVAIGRDAVPAKDAYHDPSEHPSRSEGFFSSMFSHDKDERHEDKESNEDMNNDQTPSIMDRFRHTFLGETAETKERSKVLSGGTGGADTTHA